MAKALAQAKAGKAPAKAGARGKAPEAPGGKSGKPGGGKARRPATWTKVVALVILFPFAAVLLPTTLVFFVMMAPTWVAYMTDRSRDKHLAITVGLLNLPGTLPAIIDLWTRGQSHHTAMLLLGDVFVWATAYGAAFAGWGIFAVMPTVVGSFYRMTTDARIKGLVKQQKALIAEWGHAVAEGIAVELRDGEEDAEAGEEGSDAEAADADVVRPRRAG